MAGVQRVRYSVAAVALGCLVASAFAIFWTFSSFVDYRSKDFTLVSEKAVAGTCLSAVSATQLKNAKIDSSSWSCSLNAKSELGNLLEASVHALVAANAATAFTGNASRVLGSVVSTTLGGQGHTLHRKQVYDALAQIGVPATLDCASIYSGVIAEAVAPASSTPVVVCDDVALTDAAAPTAADNAQLLAHCNSQFGYGTSGPKTGTFGIPVAGTTLSPRILPVVEVNSTTTPENRARVLVGTRWGFATIPAVLFMLTSAFFLMDSTLFLLVEFTRIAAYRAQAAITAGGSRGMREGIITAIATFQAKRNFRWAIGTLLLLVEIVVWALLDGVPWNFGIDFFPRPICEAADKKTYFLAPFHAVAEGGWRTDYDATVISAIVMLTHLLILFVLPLAEGLVNRAVSRAGARDRVVAGNSDGYTGVTTRSLRSGIWFSLLAIGGLSIFLGQAVAAFRFGVAWAQGLVHSEFNTMAIGVMLYDHVNALLYLTMTIGFALASVVGRWMLAGLSCFSFTIFVFFCFLALASFVPAILVPSYWWSMEFEGSKGQIDCQEIFGDSNDYLFARTACDVRMMTYIVGIVLILCAILGTVVLGLLSYSQALFLSRRRSWIGNKGSYLRDLTREADGSTSSYAKVHTMGAKFGTDTAFFNWGDRGSV
jgi:hypothetical protein